MAPANLHLQRVFNEAFRQFDRERRSRIRPDLRDIEVKFYPYVGLHHTIRVRSGRVYVRLSDLFRAAPPEVLRALAFILVPVWFPRSPQLHTSGSIVLTRSARRFYALPRLPDGNAAGKF